MIASETTLRSVLGDQCFKLKSNDHPRGLGLMRHQVRQRIVAPIGEIDDLAGASFLFRSIRWFEDVKPGLVEKECVIP